MTYPSFYKKVWTVCKKVPKGRITTYKLIAELLGTKAYRAVGTALHNNPCAPMVPCHRVVNSDGRIGGFAHGSAKKQNILKKEGIRFKNKKIINFSELLWKLH